MKTRSQELINFSRNHGGVIRFSSILKASFHPDSLTTLEQDKKVERIARGLYRLTDYTPGSHPDLVAASLQAPIKNSLNQQNQQAPLFLPEISQILPSDDFP